ncbi:hypothetical protein [Deinococcus multiflagellatus]|uniref:Uncharacterized protein n=1 Tax=Deinococcus multiflagellatus TaxID=1656887 RepID=A0ABW1ZNZ9_9DEIO|nr:hypothetical protein [Deinococcus multiflagellatus]MBZ9715103.1 hypothetical protein [Deinococcus multiflagellatus]
MAPTLSPTPGSGALEPHESARLKALEQTVRDGLRDFQRTGQALSDIRDNAFYRATHESFESYLQERWGFSLPQAGRLIDAANVAKVLSPIGVQPQNERQARAMKAAANIVTELEPEQQRVVARLVEAASETAPWEDAPPAAELRIMAGVVKKLAPETTVYHPDSGDEVPFESLSVPQRYEVARTQAEQKTQAYREKQEAKANAPQPEKVNWAEWCLNYAAQALGPGQRLEIVVEPGEQPRVQARVMDGGTGEVLAEGPEAGNLKRAVLNLVAEVKG